ALEALEAADAVVGVHHGVAELEVPQVREERLRRLAPRGRRTPLLAEDLLLGVDREARPRRTEAEARRDLGRDRHDRAGTPLARAGGAARGRGGGGSPRPPGGAAPRRGPPPPPRAPASGPGPPRRHPRRGPRWPRRGAGGAIPLRSTPPADRAAGAARRGA